MDGESTLSVSPYHDTEVLHEVIELARARLKSHPAHNFDLADSQANLASSIRMLYVRTNDAGLLHEIVDLQRSALALWAIGDPKINLQGCNNLAESLRALYAHTGEPTLLDERLSLERILLASRSQGDPERATSFYNVAEILRTLYDDQGQKHLLEEAVDLLRSALDLRPKGHADRSNTLDSLVRSLRKLHICTGNHNLLDEAVTLGRLALDECSREDPERPLYCDTLAISLLSLHTQVGDIQLLYEALSLKREALEGLQVDDADRPRHNLNLAAVLTTLYECTGEEDSLQEAIYLERLALGIVSPSSSITGPLYQNLAQNLQALYNRVNDKCLLEESIVLQRKASELCQDGDPVRAFVVNDLGTSLHMLYAHTNDESYLHKSLAAHKMALTLCLDKHPDRARICGNLARALQSLYRLHCDEKLLDQAIVYERMALKACPPGTDLWMEISANLALLLMDLLHSRPDPTLAEEARQLCTDAITTTRHAPWRMHLRLASLYLLDQFGPVDVSRAICSIHDAIISPSAVQDTRVLVSNAQDILFTVHQHGQLNVADCTLFLACYARLIFILHLVADYVLDRAAQLSSLQVLRSLGANAFEAAMMAGRLPDGLEMLENSRAIMWSQALTLYKLTEMDTVPVILASELQVLLESMKQNIEPQQSLLALPSLGVPVISKTLHDRHQRASRIRTLLQEIRALPGLEHFMFGSSYSELAAAATRYTVVVLVATDQACWAVVVRPPQQQPEAIVLDVEKKTLQHLVISADEPWARGAPMPDADLERSMRINRKSRQPAVHAKLNQLWVSIVKPVLQNLHLQSGTHGHSRPRLCWCPTGSFTSLALHAAGIYGESRVECCSDYVVSSYTPTLSALLRAQRNAPSLRARDLRMLLLAEPRAQLHSLPTIANVQDEAQCVQEAFATSGVSVASLVGSTTLLDFETKLPQCNMVHLACHGMQSNNDALQSCFCLGDGELTVNRLMELKLEHPFFAFMSACDTAKGDRNQPDQTVHLGAAMLFAGFKSVVATMWSIRDDDGPRIAQAFYQNLLQHEVIDVDAVAYAYDAAVQELRRSGAAPEQWAPFIHLGA